MVKYHPLFTSLNGVTGSQTGLVAAVNDCDQVEWVVTGTGTISGGNVIIEASDDPDYSGTWYQLASIAGTALSGGVKTMGKYDGQAGGFVRARAASLTGAGTVGAKLQGIKRGL